MRLNGAQIIIQLLERQGIRYVAGIPGGANLPLYDALVQSSIQHILTRHEQGAGFLAQGMARVSGQPAVCFASSGPGATNLVTAVADAYMDSIPLIAITGQVPIPLIGTDAFQEIDTPAVMAPITKYCRQVRSAEELLHVIPEAFRLAASGRPGPVVIDVPKDVQLQTHEFEAWLPPVEADPLPSVNDADLLQMEAMLAAASRPVLMVGGGVIQSGCHEALLSFAERQDIPTVFTFMGLGAMPTAHPLALGMLGMHGARYTNRVLDECDLLIGAGVRFDDRATGKVSAFCPQAAIVHIDIDASELGKIKSPTLAIHGDVGSVLHVFNETTPPRKRESWRDRVGFLKHHFAELMKDDSLFHPHGLLSALAELVDGDTNVFTDVGQHQMWTAQWFPFSRPRQWNSSGGLGTMGFGLPAAIGAALIRPQHMALCISGDGSIMMNMQELETLAEHGLNVKIVIMNNQHLGMVRQQQTLFYGGRHHGIGNSRGTDFALLAQAMGINGYDLGEAGDPHAVLRQALEQPGPALINVPISEEEMVFPMVPPGAANSEMIVG